MTSMPSLDSEELIVDSDGTARLLPAHQAPGPIAPSRSGKRAGHRANGIGAAVPLLMRARHVLQLALNQRGDVH